MISAPTLPAPRTHTVLPLRPSPHRRAAASPSKPPHRRQLQNWDRRIHARRGRACHERSRLPNEIHVVLGRPDILCGDVATLKGVDRSGEIAEESGCLNQARIPDDDRFATSFRQSCESRLLRHGSRKAKDILESKCLVLIRIEPSPAQRGTQKRRMDGDDRPETALRTPNRDDVLVFGPGKTLSCLVWLPSGEGQSRRKSTGRSSRVALGKASTRQIQAGLGQVAVRSAPRPERPGRWDTPAPQGRRCAIAQNAYATISGNSARHSGSPCDATFSLITTSAPASLNATAQRFALARKNGSSVPPKRYTRKRTWHRARRLVAPRPANRRRSRRETSGCLSPSARASSPPAE